MGSVSRSDDPLGVRIRPPGVGVPGVASQGQPYLTRLALAETSGRLSVVEVAEGTRRSARLHVHPADEAWYVLEGTYALFAEGIWSKLEPGTLLFVRGGVPHGFAVLSSAAHKLSITLSAPPSLGGDSGQTTIIEDVDVPQELWDEWRRGG